MEIKFYRGLAENFDPALHGNGIFFSTDTGEIFANNLSYGEKINDYEYEDGVLTLKTNSGRDIAITLPEATVSQAGLLSTTDKQQLTDLQDNLDSKVNVEVGKSLVADTEIAKLAALNSQDETDAVIEDINEEIDTIKGNITDIEKNIDDIEEDIETINTDISDVDLKIDNHIADKGNPHEVTKAQVGLGNVDNTSDADKPISDATQEALDNKVDKVSGKSLVDDTEIAKLAGLKSEAEIEALILAEESRATTAESNLTTALGNEVTRATGAESALQGLINGLTTRLNTLADSDDTTLDQLSEIVAYIKNNKDLIDGITTDKVNFSDIIDNLTTDNNKKVLSAAQGKALKDLIDGLSSDTSGELDKKVDKVTGKGLSTNDYTTTEKNKLAGIAEGAQVNTVTSVAGKTGAVTLAKGDVQLGNVDNTSDVDKPISTAVQGALDGKVDKDGSKVLSTNDYTTDEKNKLSNIEAGAQKNTVSSVAGKTGAVTLEKSDVGLSNVTNDAQVKASEKGVASGVATLDTNTKVPIDQLPVVTTTINGIMTASDKVALDNLTELIAWETIN